MREPPVVTQTSCEDDYDPNSMSTEAALRHIYAALTPVRDTERIALRTSLGRIVAEEVISPIDVPSHTNSAMDGYAVRAEDLGDTGTTTLRVIGTAFAGRPHSGLIQAGQAVRIMTGGVVPDGADTIVIQEHVEQTDEHIRISETYRRGDNVRAAGEDIGAGAVVLQPGQRISAAELGLLASLGIGEVTVTRCVRVAFFSTGDELRSVGEPLQPGEVYDSNRYTLYGMLTALGCEVIDMGVVRDTPAAVRTAFEAAAASADVVISSGGVSVGEADFVKQILAEVGQVAFWKVAMKPGRPLAFGHIGDAVFFGLPGNPVAVMVTFYQFVQPALQLLAGEPVRAPLLVKARTQTALKKRPGRIEYQRGVVETSADGELQVRKTGQQGSGILSSMSQANCFIILDNEQTDLAIGEWVNVQIFEGLT